MKFTFLSLCFFFTILIAYNHVSFGDFSYDFDSFTVNSGASSFVDEFNDGEEPPSGTNGPFTYSVSSPFSSDAESNGFLNLNSIDAVVDQCETFIDVWLPNIIIPGVDGSIVGKFSFDSGITPKSGFRIEIINTNGVSVYIWKSSSGRIFASFRSEGNGVGITESDTDITGSLIGITDIALKLDINIVGDVTASLDYGCDGTFDLTLPGHGTMIGTGNHDVGFGAETDNRPACDVIVNSDDSVDVFLQNNCIEPVSVELKLWVELLDQLFSILNIGSDGNIVLPPGFETTFNMGVFPTGINLEIGIRLLDPLTGEEFCVDTEIVP